VLRWFYIGVGCALLAAALYSESVRRTGRGPAEHLSRLAAGASARGLVRPAGEPVLVLYVGDAAGLTAVREAVAAERVVAEAPRGFALREGRVVALDRDAAAALLDAAGWSDRPLVMHAPRPLAPDYRPRGRSAPAPDARPGGPDLDALAQKSHLSRIEAMAVIERLD